MMAGFVAFYAADGGLAGDFRLGLYPEAQRLLETGELLEPAGTPIHGENTVYMPLTALLAVPTTVFPPRVAGWLATGVSIALLLGALAVLGVRDARIYGVVLAWEPVMSAVQTAQATPLLVFLLACAVARPATPHRAAALVGVACAVKLLVLPFIAWIVALRQPRSLLTLALVMTLLGPLLFLPFGSPLAYIDLLRRTAEAYQGQALSPYVLLGSDALARMLVVAGGVGFAVVAALVDERRAIPLAIAACILLSPIVWQHYYALLLIPLAALRPRFGIIWTIPLALWLVPFGNASTFELCVVMAVFSAVTLRLALHPAVPTVKKFSLEQSDRTTVPDPRP